LISTNFVRRGSVETPDPCSSIHQHCRFRKYAFTKTALILDDDLACVFALSSGLLELGYAAIPSHTVHEAHALVVELGAKVDLLFVNLAVPDAQAFSLQLQFESPDLEIIRLTANSLRGFKTLTASPSAILQKPDPTKAASYWIATLQKALSIKLL
jgi:hypothetical protein